jgi:hypothetical protein
MRRHRYVAAVGALAAVITVALLGRVAGQQGPATASPNATPAGGVWQAPRTPWGAPDVQGIWSSNTITPLERPAKYAGREFLTDEEVAAEVAAREQAAEQRRRAPRGTVVDLDAPPEEAARVVGAYQTEWSPAGRSYVRTKRTSLIVDPPDGRIPPLTPEGQKRADTGRWRTAYEHVRFMDTLRADGPEDRNDPERCRALQLPCINFLCQLTRIVQTSDSVSIYYEGHDGGSYRTILLDNRPHIPQQIRQWLGDSRGRWEGDTLVVETTNFSNQTNFFGATENLRLVERYKRMEPDMIVYRVTVEDPTTFTKAWTIEMPLIKADDRRNQIFEAACHEGNQGMSGILAGARAIEKEKAAADRKGSKRRGSK